MMISILVDFQCKSRWNSLLQTTFTLRKHFKLNRHDSTSLIAIHCWKPDPIACASRHQLNEEWRYFTSWYLLLHFNLAWRKRNHVERTRIPSLRRVWGFQVDVRSSLRRSLVDHARLISSSQIFPFKAWRWSWEKDQSKSQSIKSISWELNCWIRQFLYRRCLFESLHAAFDQTCCPE